MVHLSGCRGCGSASTFPFPILHGSTHIVLFREAPRLTLFLSASLLPLCKVFLTFAVSISSTTQRYDHAHTHRVHRTVQQSSPFPFVSTPPSPLPPPVSLLRTFPSARCVCTASFVVRPGLDHNSQSAKAARGGGLTRRAFVNGAVAAVPLLVGASQAIAENEIIEKMVAQKVAAGWQEPEVTQKAFMDISIGDKPAGRLVINVSERTHTYLLNRRLRCFVQSTRHGCEAGYHTV